jgi:hypothetical protein
MRELFGGGISRFEDETKYDKNMTEWDKWAEQQEVMPNGACHHWRVVR